MQTLRFDPPTGKPLFDVSWEEDREFRMCPATVSALLREQVPILDFVDWSVTSIEPGVVSATLPLNPQSTNQHFTHQASMIVLSADYTGGTALASLLRGWPVVGVHPIESSRSASLWLLRAEVKYIRPSIGDLTVTAAIEEPIQRRIVKRFLAGKPVIESIPMQFFNGDVLVAEASATYFARQSASLRAEGIDASSVNSLYQLKLTSSAELIAGVRAHMSGKLFEDAYAAEMAGQHGMALAQRFCQRSPQLGGMVAARTRHLDDVVGSFLNSGGRDIVNVGVGWDMRAFRLPLPSGTRCFELDFPTTLKERRERLDALAIADPQGIERIEVPIDVRTMALDQTLSDYLSSERPLLIIWEGMSMYFEEVEVLRILDGFKSLMKHPKTRLWFDLVDSQPIQHSERFPQSVQEFLQGMRILGEPFTFGSDDPKALLSSAGLHCVEVVKSNLYFSEFADPVYSIYQFCTASGSAPCGDGRNDGVQEARQMLGNGTAGIHIPVDTAHLSAPIPADHRL